MKQNPIGIFDSGLGGLTVLKAIAGLLPDEGTVYLGDTARVPYGNKSRETIVRYCFENARFLLSHEIKLLVIACNTASAFALEELKASLDIPVIGVIEPGARACIAATRTGRIGVIGTEGTIKSNSYVNVLNALRGGKTNSIVEHGEKRYDRYFEIKTGTARIFTKACPLFVPLAEEGWTNNDVAALTVERYLKGLKNEEIDALILGCTHYPLLKEAIARFMGGGVVLIDSAEATATEVRRTLVEKKIANDRPDTPRRSFFVTDSPERFIKVGRIFFGSGLNDAGLARLEALDYGKEKK